MTRGYPGGAPYDTCLVMFPKHSNLEQQTGPAPFNITLSTLTYTPGQNVTGESQEQVAEPELLSWSDFVTGRLLYTSPSPRDRGISRMTSSA